MLALVPQVLCQWSTAKLSEPRMRHACTALTNISIFAYGYTTPLSGSATADFFDLRTNSWTVVSLNPAAARYDLAATSITGFYERAFFGGGTLHSLGEATNVDIYDAHTGNWTTASLFSGRSKLSAATCTSKVFFAGGVNSLPPYSNVVDVYDAISRKWSIGTSLGLGRYDMAAASRPDSVMFAGGEDGARSYSYGIDSFSCSSDSHISNPSWMKRSRAAGTATIMYSYFGGGRTDIFPAPVVDQVTRHSRNTGEWTTSNSLSEARSDLAAIAVGNFVIFAGGRNNASMASAVVDILDENTNLWYTASLSQARSGPCATRVGGFAIFAGGNSGTEGKPVPSDVVDIFDTTKFVPTKKPPTMPPLMTTPTPVAIAMATLSTGTTLAVTATATSPAIALASSLVAMLFAVLIVLA